CVGRAGGRGLSPGCARRAGSGWGAKKRTPFTLRRKLGAAPTTDGVASAVPARSSTHTPSSSRTHRRSRSSPTRSETSKACAGNRVPDAPRNAISERLCLVPSGRSRLHRSKCVQVGEVVRAGPGPGYKGRMTTERPKAIDCWLNLPVGFTDYRPEFLIRVARDYFKREKEIFEPAPLPELLGQMDAAGVERAVITIDASNPEPFDDIVRAFPGKFLPSAVVDPLQGMETLR